MYSIFLYNYGSDASWISCDVGDDSFLSTIIHLNLHLGICYTFSLFFIIIVIIATCQEGV